MSSTPRIALFLPSLEGGGAERAFVELANAFVERDVCVDLVLAQETGPFVKEVAPAVRVWNLDSARWPTIVRRLVRYLRTERPDVLMSGLDIPNVAAVVASALAGSLSRCVLSQRAVLGAVWRMEFPRTWRLWLGLLRSAYPRARLVICNSHAAATEVVDRCGVPAARCAVVYNPVDVDSIERKAREPISDDWLAAGAPPLLLSVGSLTPRKDMATVIRAFAILRRSRPFNLLILGEGSERRQLERLVVELGLEGAVRMPGFDPNPFAWMARASVVISASRAEGCPNVIQQALVCGARIVATDCPGGTAEVLEHGHWGRLVPVGDAEAMATAVLAAADDPNGPDSRVRGRAFGPEAAVQAYLGYLLAGHAA